MALSKQERQQLFVQQRTAELTAAGKPVDAAALTARFNELAATPEGRQQITAKVQLANAPQAAADLIRSRGLKIFSDRARENRVKIV